MKTIPRRLLYAIFLLVWFGIVLLPALAFVLASNQQIQLGSDPQRHVRIFLLQEPESRGIGIEWARRAGVASGCSETRLAYLMWRGEGERARYCSCFDSNGQFVDSAPGRCPRGGLQP
jgi:hypothetical protein